MRILIDPGSYRCGNVGDVAMLQMGIERLRRVWPGAAISVVTERPAALAACCPGVHPVPLEGRTAFLADRFFGRADRFLPRTLRDTLAVFEKRFRRKRPVVLSSLIGAKRALTFRRDHAAPRAYVNAVRSADLVVATGAGLFTDAFAVNAFGVLATLEQAADWNIPTAVLGHGFGPVLDDRLRERMASVLARADLITAREDRYSVPLLTSLGVARDRIVVTGDDAIEMAYRVTPATIGGGIGVNLRVASFAQVNPSMIEKVRVPLQEAATRLGAPLVGVPIAHHVDRSDSVAIQQLTAGFTGTDAPVPAGELEQPIDVIKEVSRCRLVVTGSYHGAVFALAQGIPVVAMVAAEYYKNKFSGLAELFGGGCEVISLDQGDVRQVLRSAIDRQWTDADRWRAPLLEAARRQIDLANAAYRRLTTIVGARATGTTVTRTLIPNVPEERSAHEDTDLLAPVSATRRPA
jgi:polysaccharide pyruvyl transferase WcaK-like protein